MSITPETRFFHVELEFPLEKGVVVWKAQVPAEDRDGAVRQATDALWAELDYKGVKPKVAVREVMEVDEAHLTDPMSRDYHSE